ETVIENTRKKYKEHGIDEDPYVFVKNNSGTYGLGVVEAKSGDDVLSWNYKSKKKMKATKGGGGIQEVIIQEGVPSALTQDNATAEPVLYMLGHELVGGFLRTHEKKDAQQSLNSPGAVYKRLCLSDLKVSAEGCVLENVYGWVAKIGLLAIAEEAKALKIN
ncbi:MAG: glutamate--cysteine ligase, partial [Bdellovibrionales bacterium]|nr:glutamate--cysteine ligase [Bdellovibrionales bacterium]